MPENTDQLELQSRLLKVQSELVVPKDLKNNFGNYNYRSAESILAVASSLLDQQGILLTTSSHIIPIEGKIYIKSIVTARYKTSSISVEGFAQEAKTAKGMSPPQLTGSAISYSRKYALCGLLRISDPSLDPDSLDNSKEDIKEKTSANNIQRRSSNSNQNNQAKDTPFKNELRSLLNQAKNAKSITNEGFYVWLRTDLGYQKVEDIPANKHQEVLNNFKNNYLGLNSRN